MFVRFVVYRNTADAVVNFSPIKCITAELLDGQRITESFFLTFSNITAVEVVEEDGLAIPILFENGISISALNLQQIASVLIIKVIGYAVKPPKSSFLRWLFEPLMSSRESSNGRDQMQEKELESAPGNATQDYKVIAKSSSSTLSKSIHCEITLSFVSFRWHRMTSQQLMKAEAIKLHLFWTEVIDKPACQMPLVTFL